MQLWVNVCCKASSAGLFAGIELVKNRHTKEPVDEAVPAAIAAECKKLGLLIGRTNRSLAGYNNILNFSPALTATSQDIDNIVDLLDQAFENVLQAEGLVAT